MHWKKISQIYGAQSDRDANSRNQHPEEAGSLYN